jgi:hypothetical protein
MQGGKIYTATGAGHRQRDRRKPVIRTISVFMNAPCGPTIQRTAVINHWAANHPPVRIAVIQSCYIPWKGFFDLIGRCDGYVIHDRVQYVSAIGIIAIASKPRTGWNG